MERGKGDGGDDGLLGKNGFTNENKQSFRACVPTECVKTKVTDCHESVPVSWDLVFTIYNELVKLVDRLPFQKQLVVTIVFRGRKFRLDLGEVRAAGVVCLIGLGLSLGTLLLYKLYLRIVMPFLASLRRGKGDNSWLDQHYTLYLDSESEVDSMGNNGSKRSPLPNVYYSPEAGVTLGHRSLTPDSLETSKQEVRRRPKAGPRQRSPASDKDSAIGVGGGSEMSQSLYSDNGFNRDSFYSTGTAESGFDDLGFLDDLRNNKLSGSLTENFSPGSLKERSLRMLYRAHRGRQAGLNDLETLSDDGASEHSGIVSGRNSCCGSDTTCVTRTNLDPLQKKVEKRVSAASDKPRTGFYTDESEPRQHLLQRVSSLPSSTPSHMHACDIRTNNSLPTSNEEEQVVPPSSAPEADNNIEEQSSSAQSFDLSSRQEVDEEYDDINEASLPLPQSVSDRQFRNSLMQRIHEWSSFAQEYNKSISNSPEVSPIRFVRRSRSLDRHLGDASVFETEIQPSQPEDLEPVTEKNLETLEFELQGIQGEFESITSRLHDLIERGNVNTNTNSPLANASMSSSYPVAACSRNYTPPGTAHASPNHTASSQLMTQSTPYVRTDSRHVSLRKKTTHWERVSGSACSDTSSRSSRAGSVEYAWDLADYASNTPNPHDRLSSTELLCPDDASECVVNIGSPVLVSEYCLSQWKGQTPKAQAIREGYRQVGPRLHCQRMCVIRGDNYCALRATLFQVLVSGLRPTASSWGIIGIMDRLHDLYQDPSVKLSSWSFANRLPGHCKDKLASLSKCALSLYATIEEVQCLPTRLEREQRVAGLLNSSATFDLELLEGLKVMMVLRLVELRQEMLDGQEVPEFVPLLFARDSSESVSDFVSNHLNRVGDSGGLEQVEMCLLGHTLGVAVRVLRLSQSSHTDFECRYPDDAPIDAPTVCLLAEDDRHYNVPLP